MPVCKNRAWEKLEQLSFIRVAGTPEELKAAQFLKAECDAIGVEAVIEDFEIEMPEITQATFTVLEPEYKEYNVIGIGKSGATPEEGIEAEFAYIENLTDVNLENVKGKICLLQGRLTPPNVEKLVKKFNKFIKRFFGVGLVFCVPIMIGKTPKNICIA